MTKRERLAEFFRRLAALPKFCSHDEALTTIQEVFTAVEDEFSGVPRDPTTDTPEETQDRMYPPHPDYERLSDKPGFRRYDQLGHLTYIGDGGHVIFVDRRSKNTVYDKHS